MASFLIYLKDKHTDFNENTYKMKKTKFILLISILLVIISFLTGYFWNTIFSKKPVYNNAFTEKTLDSIPKREEQNEALEQYQSPETTNGFSKELNGKYILEGAEYAGFDFIDHKTLTWTNELVPMYPDTMRLKWVSEDVFVGIFTKKHNEDCSPNVWVNKVVSYDGKTLVLKDIWTGWGDSKDELKTFHLEEE